MLRVFACLAFAVSFTGAAFAVVPPSPGRTIKLLTVDTVVAADGTSVMTIHAEIRADNESAAMSVGQSGVAYNTANQSLEILEAYTQKPDGRKIAVDVSAIYDQLPPGTTEVPMFTDMHVKSIVFPQLSAGDTAVYTARVTTKRAIFPGQFWYGDTFTHDVAFDEVRETLTAPAGLELHVENHDVEFSRSRDGANIIYRWHYSAPVAMAPEAFAVAPLAHTPRFFISTFSDYAALGRAYATAAASQSAVTPTIKSLADSIVKDTSDNRRKAQLLYEWVVGHIRYVGIELGRGILIPHPAETVLSNGYGDCKDHVVLLAALLKAEGMDSEGVLLNATNTYALSDVATFTALDHIITYIPSLDLYLDSTTPVAPFGVLPFQEYGKPAVYASQTDPRLGMTPVLAPGRASVSTKTVSRLGADGKLSGSTTTTATGPYSIALRALGLGIQAMGPETAATRLLTALGYGVTVSGTLNAPAPTMLGESYTVTGMFSNADWSKELAGNEQFYIPGGMRLLGLSGDGLMGTFAGSNLKPDAEMPCYSANADEELSLEAPPGAHFALVPSDTHVKTAYLAFDAHWTLDGNTLSVHRTFTSTIDLPLCSAAIRADNAKALQEISDSYNVQLSFGPPDLVQQSPPPSANTADPEFATMLANVNDAIQRHDDDMAISVLSTILARPDLPLSVSFPARYDRAMAYARHWRYEEALADLTAALQADPGDAHMLAARAHVYFLQADWSRARSDCETALQSAPNAAPALHIRANIAMETGQYEDAVRDYTAELQAEATQAKQFPNVYVLRAVAYHRLGHEAEAAGDVAMAGQLGDKKAQSDFDAINAPVQSDPPARGSDNSSVASAEPANAGLGTLPPQAANRHMSTYPPLSRRLDEEGRVEVAFTIEADGSVADPRVVKSSGFPGLDAAALSSVMMWQYRPALRDGKPVAVLYRTIVSWKLNPA